MQKLYIRIGWHLVNGSPVYPVTQLQIGLWLTTWHRAWIPQVPGQGSLHFWLMHASFGGQSELTTHSGLHEGGAPIKPSIHEQTAWPLCSLHLLFGPHGDGLQGFMCSTAIGKHWINAFPLMPAGQLHVGMWLYTLHVACWPQTPGHGSLHLFLIQASCKGHSLFIVHSGRHIWYGSPWYSGKHVQIPSVHWALAPHGEGSHESVDWVGSKAVI